MAAAVDRGRAGIAILDFGVGLTTSLTTRSGARRAGARSSRLFTVRGGKVRSVAVAAPRTIARATLLRRSTCAPPLSRPARRTGRARARGRRPRRAAAARRARRRRVEREAALAESAERGRACALGREVREQQQPLAGVLAPQAEDVVVARSRTARRAPWAWTARVARARGDEPPQPGPQPPLDGRPGRAGARPPSQSIGGRCIQRLSSRVRGVVVPAVVVAQPELVAHVDQRQAAVGEGDRVEQQHPADRELDARARRRARAPPRARPATPPSRSCARRRSRGLAWKRAPRANEPGSRRRRSRRGSAGAGSRPRRPRRVLLGDRPADVVVAAHVGHPARAGRHAAASPAASWVMQRDAAARRASSTAAP